MHNKRKGCESRGTREDLSHDDLLFLLSILEGELQARDEVIAVLKSEKTDSHLQEAHYGCSERKRVLRSLQRDSLWAQQDHLQDVYVTPILKFSQLLKAQKCSSIRMTKQFQEISRAHSEAVRRLEEQERSHAAFIYKSNGLTTLLEHDRKRLKLLLVKEKEYQAIKERKNEREISILQKELTKLKSFALLVVNEQQCLGKVLEEQRHRITELTAITDHIEEEVSAVKPRAKVKEDLKSQHLEVKPDNPVYFFRRSQNTMTAPGLLSEVEVLRKRVVEMEGKDEELIRMADQCRDLDRRLANEASHCRSLKVEVDKLGRRISELDRIEEALGKSKHDCSLLKSSLERERENSKILSDELDTLRLKVRELEAVEGQLKKSEMVISQDLGKLRSLTVALVEERKSMAERLRQAEEKLNRKEGKRNEQSNLATVTERLREEKQQAVKSKEDLEEKIRGIVKEKGMLQGRLETEEERNRELQSKITLMKKRLQVLENWKEKEEKYSSLTSKTAHHCQSEDNKVKELTKELDKLQKKLQDKELLEGELMKVEEDFEALEKKFREEQRRSRALTDELEVAKRELSRYEQAEKPEVNQEHLLLCRLQKEQVKSRLLTREVDSLKEKLQKMMGTEESICRVQMDQSTLQRKLAQQEAKNKDLAREMKELISELDKYRQIKNLTPAASRDFSNPRQTTKEVQTEPAESLLPIYHDESERLDEEKCDEDSNRNTEVMNRRGSIINSFNSLNSANNNIGQHSSHSGIDMHQTANGDVMMLTHTPGQPLHIKVTPHHILNTATLEFSSPTGDAATSYTSTALIPTAGASPKQRITIIQNSGPPAANPKSPSSSPDCTVSPLNGTPNSRILSPNSSRSVTPDHCNSPIQIVAVRTCSPEPSEVSNQAVFCKTPERQNSWQHQKSNSTDTSPSIITTEDNKIHIHLGSPYIQSLNGVPHGMPQPAGPYYVRHEQRTQVLANGCHVKGVGKITSSITISPANSPASHSSNITVSGLCD